MAKSGTASPGDRHKQWAQAIQDGNSAAESQLVAEFHPLVVRQIIAKIGDRSDDWRDLASEVLMDVIMNLRRGNFDSDKGQLPSYIFIITRNKIARYLEKSSRRRAHIELFDPQMKEVLAENCDRSAIERQERIGRLQKMIAQLPQKYREVLEMRFLKELRVKDIAVHLNLASEQKVSNRISYALRLLRESGDRSDFFSIFLFCRPI